MSVTWVIHHIQDQTMIHQLEREASEIEEAILATGYNLQPLLLPPFSTDLPPCPEGPTVLYGGTRLVEAAALHPEWKKSVWYDAEGFRWSHNAEQWGDLSLMQDYHVTTFRDCGNVPYWSGDILFVRPDADLKEFSGRVLPRFSLVSWRDALAEITEERGATMNLDTKIIVGKVLTIEREWRVFVVDSKPVECSRYLNYGTLDRVREFPPEVREFAEKVCATYLPAPVVVVDIGYADGRYGVVEANCFNGSGWYSVSINRVVQAVSKYVEGK